MNVFDNMKGTEHVVAESTRLAATHWSGHIYDLRAIADTENGSIVSRGAYEGAQVYKAKAYAAGEHPYLVLTTPICYNNNPSWHADEKYFYNAKDEKMRCYLLEDEDEYTVSANAITALATTPKVGNYVSVQAGLYKEAASAGSTGFVAQIVDEIKRSNGTYYVLHVVSTGV